MLTLLLIDQGSVQADTLAARLEELRALPGIGETIIVSPNASPAKGSTVAWIQSSNGFHAAMQEAINLAACKRTLITSSLVIDSPNIADIINDANERSRAEHVYYPVQGSSELPPFEAEFLIDILTRFDSSPFACTLTSRGTLADGLKEEISSFGEMMIRSLASAAAEGDSIITSSLQLAGNPDAIEKALTINETERAQCLATVVDRFAIEELFPNHPWQNFSAESAAAAYHTLAAVFIRFNDFDSANSCLSCSEQLEESPRYFALKALIARGKGEILGAVANMVSSLQCYEARKKNDGAHYLTFTPKDLGQVNSYLVDGLESLNTRDNERAFDRFREAVSNFDGFYSDLGVLEGE